MLMFLSDGFKFTSGSTVAV